MYPVKGDSTMKKALLIFSSVLLVLFCTACGAKNAELPEVSATPEKPVESNTPDTPEQTTPINPSEDENESALPQKIHLDGQIISYNKFPIPEAEAFALTGEEANLYRAAVNRFNRDETPEYFASDSSLDLILPSISVLGKYTTDEGNTAYVVNFVKCFFFDLGSGLAHLNNPVYTSTYLNNLASFTLDKDGNLVAFDELGDGEDHSAVYRICGHLTDIADEFLVSGWPEGIARIPGADSYEDMLQQYLNYYFED